MGDRSWRAAVALLALPLLGMGAFGGGASGTPERNYQGTFVDLDGTRVDAKWINVGGDLALTGDLGRGNLRVPFDNVKKVEFSSGEGRDGLVAKVSLRKGEQVDLKIRSSVAFAGQTAVGQYRVRARDLKSLELQAE
jgi:hypothetical protein